MLVASSLPSWQRSFVLSSVDLTGNNTTKMWRVVLFFPATPTEPCCWGLRVTCHSCACAFELLVPDDSAALGGYGICGRWVLTRGTESQAVPHFLSPCCFLSMDIMWSAPSTMDCKPKQALPSSLTLLPVRFSFAAVRNIMASFVHAKQAVYHWVTPAA